MNMIYIAINNTLLHIYLLHSRGLCHEVIIEKALSFGEATAHNMLIFLGHLFLHICFDTAEQEGP